MAAPARKQPKSYGISALLVVVGVAILAFGLLGALVAKLVH
jgi:hypothetical protein